jgi:hypothetical protein
VLVMETGSREERGGTDSKKSVTHRMSSSHAGLQIGSVIQAD